ncbi:hypothetical protein [Streptomyces sp. NPDC048603]|uniref:hypothetical protein n=1 Tax=Streptomyces sp. NPDC048603 TaxID=3365577 RepID=UPI003720D09A
MSTSPRLCRPAAPARADPAGASGDGRLHVPEGDALEHRGHLGEQVRPPARDRGAGRLDAVTQAGVAAPGEVLGAGRLRPRP